jgi:hypothetical protein
MLSCRYHGNVQSAPFRRVQNPPGNNFVLVIGCELGQRELGRWLLRVTKTVVHHSNT